MGTNYYARIIPSVESKTKLQEAIEKNDFNTIDELTTKMYAQLGIDNGNFYGGKIHLGKRSAGWKFLWNPNVYVTRDIYKDKDSGEYRFGKYIPKFLYPLTKDGIKEFIQRDDVEIYDEYDEIQNKDEFFEMAINWVTWKNKEAWDSKTYYKEYPNNYSGYTFRNENDLTKYLDQESINYISDSHSDFYMDGLRFSTNTDFS